MVMKAVVITSELPLYLLGKNLIFCFVLPLPQLFGTPELGQIHFLLWFQTLSVKKKKIKLNFEKKGRNKQQEN